LEGSAFHAEARGSALLTADDPVGLDLSQNARERRALSYDLLEVLGDLYLFFEIELLFGELILERYDLAEGERVFDSYGDLTGDLAEQLDLMPCARRLRMNPDGLFRQSGFCSSRAWFMRIGLRVENAIPPGVFSIGTRTPSSSNSCPGKSCASTRSIAVQGS
jgi:hypothetical protein